MSLDDELSKPRFSPVVLSHDLSSKSSEPVISPFPHTEPSSSVSFTAETLAVPDVLGVA